MAAWIKEQVDDELEHHWLSAYADVHVVGIPTPEDLLKWVNYCNKPLDLAGAVDSVYNRHPGLRRDQQIFKQFSAELNLMPVRQFTLFKYKRLNAFEANEKGAHTYCLRRRYVSGNHKFSSGSILNESPEHRKWRQKHAKNTRKRRHMSC
jgi:hypothetical protein